MIYFLCLKTVEIRILTDFFISGEQSKEFAFADYRIFNTKKANFKNLEIQN